MYPKLSPVASSKALLMERTVKMLRGVCFYVQAWIPQKKSPRILPSEEAIESGPRRYMLRRNFSAQATNRGHLQALDFLDVDTLEQGG